MICECLLVKKQKNNLIKANTFQGKTGVISVFLYLCISVFPGMKPTCPRKTNGMIVAS